MVQDGDCGCHLQSLTQAHVLKIVAVPPPSIDRSTHKKTQQNCIMYGKIPSNCYGITRREICQYFIIENKNQCMIQEIHKRNCLKME